MTIIKDKLSALKFEIIYLFRRSNYNPKVFCIGYNKTGTTTIGIALSQLGYVNSSFNKKVWRKYYKQGKIEKIISYTAKFDSFDDLPWLKEDMIPILDQRFPNSKFIYLERDEESWVRSYDRWTFNTFGFHPDIEQGLKNYRDHKEFVLSYFKDRSNDLLILNVKDEKAFSKLAKFLGKQAPSSHLPHFNKSQL